jgi:hypothetical protein
MKKYLFVLSLFYSFSISAQEPDTYRDAYDHINKMLTGEEPLNFKKIF